MTSSVKNSSAPPIPAEGRFELFEFYQLDFPELPKMIEDMFPLYKEDRDELVRQVFDHFLNVNSLNPTISFRLNVAMLRVAVRETPIEGAAPAGLTLLAQNVFAHIYDVLVKHGFHRLTALQGGFYFVLDRIRDNGHQVVLRNISPQIHSTQRRYDPALYP